MFTALGLSLIIRVYDLFGGGYEYKRLTVYHPYLDNHTLCGIDRNGARVSVPVSMIAHVQPAPNCRKKGGIPYNRLVAFDVFGRLECEL